MKRALILCSVAVMCFFSSCKDECEGVTCLNDGVCVDGTCNCPTGYSGVNCEIEPDPCEDVTCANGGVCVDGTCDCPTGYSGANCQTVDPCAGVACVNGTATASGSICTCACDTGYEGAACDTLVKTKLLGTHNGNEGCTSGNDAYAVTITSGTTDVDIIISNLYDAALVVEGSITGPNTFNIPAQVFGVGNISGSGTVSGTTLTITFTVTSGGSSDTCSFVTTL